MGKSKRKKANVARKGHANDEEVDFETLVKEEFKKLHRQYRLMEDARHAIAGASGKLSKQGKLLERLREEKEDLLTDIKNARCRAYRAKDKSSIKTILEALERYERYKQDITACLMSIAEMESNVDRITERLVEQKLKVQALYGQSMTVPQADHRKRILENRLYHVTTQFDTLVSQNKELKQEINMMLKLRGSFYRRMLAIKKLSAKIKQRMGEVVTEATAAYDQRDEWVNKINILRERNDKDSKQHVLEIKEFQRVLHHDSKIHEFLAIKNKDRDQLESIAQRQDRKNFIKIADLDQLLAAYKKSFQAILRIARSRDIESLVNTYLEEEQKNFALLRFITDLNYETNCLQEDIEKIKTEIEDLAKANKETTKNQEDTLAKLDADLEALTTELETSVSKWTENDHSMEILGRLVDETFNIAGCDNEYIIGILGNQTGMRPHNICLVLKVIEHRTTELIFEKGLLEVRKIVEVDGNPLPKKQQLWVAGQKSAPQGGPFKPQVHVVGRVDTEQDDDDNETKAWAEKPVYYAEMKETFQKPAEEAGSRSSLTELGDARMSSASAMEINKMSFSGDYQSSIWKKKDEKDDKIGDLSAPPAAPDEEPGTAPESTGPPPAATRAPPTPPPPPPSPPVEEPPAPSEEEEEGGDGGEEEG